MEAIISILNNILGIYTWLEQKIGKTKAIIVLSFIILIGAVFSIRSCFPKVEDIQKQPEISRNQTIQDNHGTINNIENQTINNYSPHKADNEIVVKKEKRNFEEVFLEIPIRLDNKSKGYSKIFVEGKEALFLPNSLPNNPWISIKSIPSKNQEIMIITNNGDTCFINSIFDEKNKANFPPNFIPLCKK